MALSPRAQGRRLPAQLAAALVAASLLVGCSTQGLLSIEPDASVLPLEPSAAVVDEIPELAPEPEIEPEPKPQPEPSPLETARFQSTVDGDTIRTDRGTVRIIGIDTPERGECGHQSASMLIDDLLSAGDEITLERPDNQSSRDRYDRMLRFVTTANGIDIGLVQLEAGNAVARYDSSDGYPRHDREEAYRAAQSAVLLPDGTVVTASCSEQTAPEETEQPWWTQYGSCAQLKRNTVGHPKGPFRQGHASEGPIYDWFVYGTGHNGDGDHDGLACE